MNTSPDATTVLCYGDSNTYGLKPNHGGRFAVNERWSGILQKRLGDGYYLIEEGLSGRTTDLDYDSPDKPSRNGLVYFKACLDSHMPLDIIIIMLGTNDLKTVFNRTAKDIAQALKQYPDYVKRYCAESNFKQPRIILASPAYIDEKTMESSIERSQQAMYDTASIRKSRQLAELIRKVAEETGCVFFDAAAITKTGKDGRHFDKQSHQKLADSFSELIEGWAQN